MRQSCRISLSISALIASAAILFSQTPGHTLAEQPKSAEAFTLLGHLDYLKGDFGDAEMDFKRALQLDTKVARAWLGLGRVFEAASMRAKAKLCYETAWKADPDDPEVRRYYARTLKPAERLAALERYLAAPGNEDPELVDGVRRRIDALKWAGDRTPFALSSGVGSDEIRLSLLRDGPDHVRGYSLPVSFNGGKPLHLLMDSGAGGIVLNRKAAEAAGLRKITDLKFWGIGDEGDRTGYTAAADRVKIGNVTFDNCPVAVSDRKFLTDEDGLIGTDVFSDFLITIDFQKLVLKLDPLPGHAAAAGADPDWQDRQTPAELSRFHPFFALGHDILLPTRVNGAKPVLFLADTGATSSLIEPDYARQFTGLWSDDRITMKGVSGKVKKVESAGQMSFEFAGYRQPVRDILSIALNRREHESPRMTGLFGISTLTQFRIRIDYRDGLIDFDYIGPKYQ